MSEMCLPDARPPNYTTTTRTIPDSTDCCNLDNSDNASLERRSEDSGELFVSHHCKQPSSDQSNQPKCLATMSTSISEAPSRSDQLSDQLSASRRSSIDSQNGPRSSANQLGEQLNRLDTIASADRWIEPALQSFTSQIRSAISSAASSNISSSPMPNYSNQSKSHSGRLSESLKMSAHRRSTCQMRRIRSESNGRLPFVSVRATAKGLISYVLVLMYSLMSGPISRRRLAAQLAGCWFATKVVFRSAFRSAANLRAEFIYLLPLKKPNQSSNLSNSNSRLTAVHSERFNDCLRAPNVETKNQSRSSAAGGEFRLSSSYKSPFKRRGSTNHFRWLLARNAMLFVLLTAGTSSAYEPAGPVTNYNLNNINGFNGYQLLANNARNHPSITNPAKRSGSLGGRSKPDAVIYFEDLKNEQFTHLTINPFNSDVYIGAVNRLYQLNSNLQVKHLANMGPQLDSAECPGKFLFNLF